MVKWLPVNTELVEAIRQQAPSIRRTQPARHAFWRCVHIFELDLKDWSVIVYCGSRMLKGVRTETEHQAHFTGIAGRSHTNGKRTHALDDLDGSQMSPTIWKILVTLQEPDTVKHHGDMTLRDRDPHPAAGSLDRQAHHHRYWRHLRQQQDLQLQTRGRR